MFVPYILLENSPEFELNKITYCSSSRHFLVGLLKNFAFTLEVLDTDFNTVYYILHLDIYFLLLTSSICMKKHHSYELYVNYFSSQTWL